MNSIESTPIKPTPKPILEPTTIQNKPARFTFISTCPEIWGGSEELWWGAAQALLQANHEVAVFKTNVDRAHPKIRRLQTLGCRTHDLLKARVPIIGRAVNFVAPPRFQLTAARRQMIHLAVHLKRRQPDLVVISQGDNYDGLHFGNLCCLLRVPYVLVSQKAPEIFWPTDAIRLQRRQAFEGARRCFFVSRHNRRVTEEQTGCALPNAEVISNPCGVENCAPLAWPTAEPQTGAESEFRLACVARLYVLDKGQDILLRVLARPHWKARPLRVNFFGRGVNHRGLLELAKMLELDSVNFIGHTSDIKRVWREHQALILPSRAEGLPLSLVEAMMCGRPAIVTDVGGNAEVVQDESSGFLATGANESALDEALERAWQRRDEWQQMGVEAHRQIRQLVPQNPVQEFTDKLLVHAKAS